MAQAEESLEWILEDLTYTTKKARDKLWPLMKQAKWEGKDRKLGFEESIPSSMADKCLLMPCRNVALLVMQYYLKNLNTTTGQNNLRNTPIASYD